MNSVRLTEFDDQFEDQIELKTKIWLQIEFIIKIDFKFDLGKQVCLGEKNSSLNRFSFYNI